MRRQSIAELNERIQLAKRSREIEEYLYRNKNFNNCQNDIILKSYTIL